MSKAPTPPVVPLHPKAQITFNRTGESGNAFVILGRATTALRRAGVGEAEVGRFIQEATRADYEHLVATAKRWVHVASERRD